MPSDPSTFGSILSQHHRLSVRSAPARRLSIWSTSDSAPCGQTATSGHASNGAAQGSALRPILLPVPSRHLRARFAIALLSEGASVGTTSIARALATRARYECSPPDRVIAWLVRERDSTASSPPPMGASLLSSQQRLAAGSMISRSGRRRGSGDEGLRGQSLRPVGQHHWPRKRSCTLRTPAPCRH
jgi:hypothetical protein